MKTNKRIERVERLIVYLDGADTQLLLHAILRRWKEAGEAQLSVAVIEEETADLTIQRRLQRDSPRFNLTNGQQDEYEQSIAAELAGDYAKADSLWTAILNTPEERTSKMTAAKKKFGELIEAQGSFDIRKPSEGRLYNAVDTTTGESVGTGVTPHECRTRARAYYRNKLKAETEAKTAKRTKKAKSEHGEAAKGKLKKEVTHSGHKFRIYDRGDKAAGASVRFCAENVKGETVASGADYEICRDMLRLYAKDLDEPTKDDEFLDCPKCDKRHCMGRAFPNNTVFVCDECGHTADLPETRTISDEVKFHFEPTLLETATALLAGSFQYCLEQGWDPKGAADTALDYASALRELAKSY